jgi:hypothetical protein
MSPLQLTKIDALTIVRYFPHEVADLPIALAYMQLPNSPARDPQNWSLRYVILLWLGLVCMLPFDLKQFDDDDDAIGIARKGGGGGASLSVTAARLDSLAREYLGKAGLEREGAAILLARLYTRYSHIPLLDSPTERFNAIVLSQI